MCNKQGATFFDAMCNEYNDGFVPADKSLTNNHAMFFPGIIWLDGEYIDLAKQDDVVYRNGRWQRVEEPLDDDRIYEPKPALEITLPALLAHKERYLARQAMRT